MTPRRRSRRKRPSAAVFLWLVSSSQAFYPSTTTTTLSTRIRRLPATTIEENVQREIEYAAHPHEDKLERSAGLIAGTINVTSIEVVHNNKERPMNVSTRTMWQRRNARSAEEGIRREKASVELSSLLARAGTPPETTSKRYAARTITGLINALAEEVDDLEVEVDARRDTPLWGKHVDAVRIKFSRLGFKPLRMGGLDETLEYYKQKFPDTERGAFTIDRQLTELECADEAFARIDADNSGALDRDEIAEALTVAAGSSDEAERKRMSETLKGLASELVALYDFNGDGVISRDEYQSMVEDMAALREAQKEEERKKLEAEEAEKAKEDESWFTAAANFVSGSVNFVTGFFNKNQTEAVNGTGVNGESGVMEETDLVVSGAAEPADLSLMGVNDDGDYAAIVADQVRDQLEAAAPKVVSESEFESVTKSLGSITLSDLKLDLRRLLFGAVPILKHITPGGPLVLEPFTATVTGSFNRDDILNSFLLDAGLRRLVAQALKRRVRSFRDLMDGAVFYGRTWKMSSATAPRIEVLELTNVEFDRRNKLIVTGRVRVQTRPESPVIENAFKLRTKLGTRMGGRRIRLVEPELALVLECPKAWEENIAKLYDLFGFDPPTRPEPLYSFFPIYSPFKLEDDNDGFDLGEDNRIKSIYVQDEALRFELSAVLRPGRFLGNHYLAFTIPNRTFIITLDRVKEGIRAARKMKRAANALKDAAEDHLGSRRRLTLPQELESVKAKALDGVRSRVQPKSFFSRFVDGYLRAERDDEGERVRRAIRDFFGRQGGNSTRGD